MTITTRTVSIVVNQIIGTALPRARVRFELTEADIDGGVVAPYAKEVTLSADGVGSVALWPNVLGSQGTQYRVTIRSQDGDEQYSGLATVPNTNCNLHSILDLDAPPASDDLDQHIENTEGAHAASAIGFDEHADIPGADDVQAAIVAVLALIADIVVSAGAQYADNEVPAGSIDGVNAAFTLAHTPNPAASLILVRNGSVQRPSGVDYTLTGDDIVYNTAPSSGDTHVCWYRYV